MALLTKRQVVLLTISAATSRRMTTSATAAGRMVHGSSMMMSSCPLDAGGALAFISARGPSCRPILSRAVQKLLPMFQPSTTTTTPAATMMAISSLTRRHLSSNSNSDDNDCNDTSQTSITLPNKTGDRNGLIRHELIADDGHPLRVYSRNPRPTTRSSQLTGINGNKQRSILLLHGRTWSSQPVFDLRTSDTDDKQQSTLQSLADLGFHVYALDLRGFGETPRDYDANGNGGYTTPRRCVADVKCAIDWITERHPVDDNDETNNSTSSSSIPFFEDPTVINTRPALLGWSQGALVAQMYAQKHGPSTLSDLILFGSIFDPRVIYSRKPLYDPSGRLLVSMGGENNGGNHLKPPAPEVANTDIASLEDFTLPGTICDEAALTFSSLALAVDTIKASWDELHEFNICNPALVHIPTLVMVGAQDPYVSWEAQRELFERLGTEDKAMCVLPGCDHAAHILKARKMFVRGVAGFLLRKDGF
ncbi:hypothetical protein ACHAXR_002214 [Thalassiosira sp. AJA248-18]